MTALTVVEQQEPEQRAPVLQVDLLVVGAGPVGLYGAYYAGMRGLECAVVDVLPEPGGQVTALYPEKAIYDIAGFPAVKGRDLVAGLVEQAGAFEPVYLLGRTASTLRHDAEGSPVVTTDDGLEVHCRAVVVTGGIGTFVPRPLPVGQEWLGRGVVHVVPRPDEHRGQDVVVLGGGDSAVDWALMLEPLARSVTLVHRRERFRAHAGSVAGLRRSSVRVLAPGELVAVRGDDVVREVEVSCGAAGTEVLAADAVVGALGFLADLGPLETWGMTLQDRHVVVDTTMATNLPRVYAAGDITAYRGKVRLISVGFGEVATAVNNAATVLDPRAPLFPGHSTDRQEA